MRSSFHRADCWQGKDNFEGNTSWYFRGIICGIDGKIPAKTYRRPTSLSLYLHPAHGLTVVLLPFRTEVLRGAIFHRSVIDNVGQPSSQICRVSSQMIKIRLGIIEIQNSFFEVVDYTFC